MWVCALRGVSGVRAALPPGCCSAFWLSAVGAQAEKCPFVTLHSSVSPVLVTSGLRKAAWELPSLLPGAEGLQSSLLAQRHLPRVSWVVCRQLGPWSQTI